MGCIKGLMRQPALPKSSHCSAQQSNFGMEHTQQGLLQDICAIIYQSSYTIGETPMRTQSNSSDDICSSKHAKNTRLSLQKPHICTFTVAACTCCSGTQHSSGRSSAMLSSCYWLIRRGVLQTPSKGRALWRLWSRLLNRAACMPNTSCSCS